MPVRSTLSTTQWSQLQASFERAMSVSGEQREALLQALYESDELVAEALAGMLGAADRWRGRTGAARANLVRQVEPIASLHPGDTLGLYRIVGEIGRGGMGRVYLGERSDGRVQQRVAIKIIRPGELDNFTRDRFRLERELLAGFNHPNIARLFDAGESASGEPYFVMEYVQGETLTKYCDEHRLGIRDRLELFLSVCDAVRYAHSKLVLHRDLKPGNILVDEHGVAKLIDFGIAKPLPTLDADDAQATATQRRFFSPLNAAPEQLRGERAGLACDVYQLGTVLYELLCGFPIFDLEGKSPAQIEDHILQHVPTPPSVRVQRTGTTNEIAQARNTTEADALARRLRGDLDEIVLLALRKEPERRYASVEQLGDDIQRHLGDLPVQARGQHGWYRASRFARRHWRSLTAAGIVALFTIGFVITLLIQGQRLAQERDRAVQEQRTAQDITQFLIGVFKAADPSESLMRDTPVGTVLDRGREKLQSGSVGSPAIRSRILLALAEVYLAIDDFPAAQELGGKAIDAYRQSPARDVREWLAMLDRYSEIALTTLNFDRAKASADEAMQAHATLGDTLEQSWQSQLNQIKADHRQHEPEACTALLGLVNRLRMNAATDQEPFATAAIATTQCNSIPGSDTEQDIARVREGLSILDRIYAPEDPRLARAHHALATWLSLEEALPVYQKLLERQERIFGPESLAVANELFGLATIYADTQRDAEAEADYLRAQGIYSKIHKGKLRPRDAEILVNLGNLHDWPEAPTPQEDAKADQYYQKAVHTAELVYDANSSDLASIRTTYGFFKLHRGDYKVADELFRKAIPVVPIDTSTGLFARANEAEVLFRLGRLAESEQLVRLCEPIASKDPKKYARSVQVLADLRKMTEGVAKH